MATKYSENEFSVVFVWVQRKMKANKYTPNQITQQRQPTLRCANIYWSCALGRWQPILSTDWWWTRSSSLSFFCSSSAIRNFYLSIQFSFELVYVWDWSAAYEWVSFRMEIFDIKCISSSKRLLWEHEKRKKIKFSSSVLLQPQIEFQYAS